MFETPSLHKFGYSSEQLKLREYQEPKDMIKSQEKLTQITHSKLKEDLQRDFENDTIKLDENHELYDTINKKVIEKMKIETSPIIELDNFLALRSKLYSFSYGATQKLTQKTVQKSKQKGIQHTPPYTQFINSLFNSETTTATKYSICSDAHNLTVQKQDKLALNPFDDKRLYLNPIQSLSWDKHTQKGDCPCIYCLKLIGLYYKELSTRDGKPIRDRKDTITFGL